MFTRKNYIESTARSNDPISAAMILFDKDSDTVPYLKESNASENNVKRLLDSGAKYVVIVDNKYRFRSLVFKKDFEPLLVAAAISTHPGWLERVKELERVGVDLIVMDTSDAHSEFAEDLVREYKRVINNIPLCAGNIVTYEGAMDLLRAGADMIKEGMSPGSICTTRREKGVGRPPMTSALETARARDDFYKETHRYAPLLGDGGITGAADMAMVSTVVDAFMLGGRLNGMFEAAGKKLDGLKNEIEDPGNNEDRIVYVVSFGEGSKEAQNSDRYGHSSTATFFEEGRKGEVDYVGRLKPVLKGDMMRLRGTLTNVGVLNLKDYRAEVVIELVSPEGQRIVGNTHNLHIR